jgi:hypothetical protein
MTQEERHYCWQSVEARAGFKAVANVSPMPDSVTAVCKLLVEERKLHEEEMTRVKSMLVQLVSSVEDLRDRLRSKGVDV